MNNLQYFRLEETVDEKHGGEDKTIRYFFCDDIAIGTQVFEELTGENVDDILDENFIGSNELVGFTIGVETIAVGEHSVTISPTVDDGGGMSDIEVVSVSLSEEDIETLFKNEQAEDQQSSIDKVQEKMGYEMTENEKLNHELYVKMSEAQNAYREWLLEKPREEILYHAYQYMVRADIVLSLEYNDLSDEQAKALLALPDPLEAVFKDFERLETDHMADIWHTVEARADMELRKQNK